MSHESRNSTLVVFGDSLSDNGNLFDLIGQPAPPAWEGRASNCPTYAEQLAKMLHMRLDDRAFAAAEASDASPPVLVDRAGHPLPINLANQVAGYIADLHGHQVPHNTTVLINIGSNDYQGFLQHTPPTPLNIQAEVQNVVGSIAQAIDTLTQAGVEKIVLFTLPDFGITPAAQALGPDAVALAHLLDVANNAALEQLAASHPNVQVVDIFQLSEALFADPHSFGFSANLNQTWVGQLTAGSHQFAPNEVAFFDGIHPTTAAHGILAAFADAVLTSDSTQFLDGTQSVIHAGHGDDVIFAGSGNVTVHGGSGSDLIAAGSGNATLDGGSGADVLETNSTGTNILAGGGGGDALIVNRAGTNTLLGGSGNDFFVFKESASIVKSDGSFNFGQQVISGGSGHDTLKFIINDQNANAESALIAEFLRIESAFDLAARHGHAGSFEIDGLRVTGIERIELQIDSVSTNPNTPYLITHDIALADGRGGQVSDALSQLLQTADHWNLLTV